MISDRWELKIGDFGMGAFRIHQTPAKRSTIPYKFPIIKLISELLWTAPEILRSGDLAGSQKGDVFSFAIVCSELINQEVAWNNVSDDKEIEGNQNLSSKS